MTKINWRVVTTALQVQQEKRAKKLGLTPEDLNRFSKIISPLKSVSSRQK